MLSAIVLAASASAATPAKQIKRINAVPEQHELLQKAPRAQQHTLTAKTAAAPSAATLTAKSYVTTNPAIANIKSSISGAKIEHTGKSGALRVPDKPNTLTMAEYSTVYDLSCSWGLRTGSAPATLTITVTDEATGAAEVTGLRNDITPLSATIDLDACTLSIPNKQRVGEDSDGPVYFYVKAIGNGGLEDGASTAEATVGTIDGQTITFPWDDAWAIGDFDNEGVGLYYLSYNNSLTIHVPEDPNKDPNEGWTSLGMATFMDGWLLPGFGVDQTDVANQYKVELQQNDDNHNVYRLVDPYKGNFPMASSNQSTKTGYIQFDVTDPDHVVFANVDAGFSLPAAGITEFYCNNRLSYFVNAGYTADNVIEQLGDKLPYTTFKDGVVTLGFVDNDGDVMYDACYGEQDRNNGAYGWIDDNDAPANMSAKIIFPTTTTEPGTTYTWTSLGMGKYKASSLAALYGASTDPVDIEVFEANEQPGIYKFVGLWPDMTDNGSMIVDATDPDFVIVHEQPTGFVDEYDGMTYIVSVVARYLEKYDKETIAAALSDQVITMTDGVISFPEDAFQYRWPDASAKDSPFGTDPESYYLGESNVGGYALLPGATVVEPDPNEGWTTLGMATLMDGWVLPCYGIDQTDSANWYEVELQQNNDDENVYRLVDPYHGESPVASQNHTNSVGYIQFDVTNPARVRFATDVYSGFVNSKGQKIYCSNTFNWLTLYFDLYDLTEEDVLEELGEDYQFSTFENGIVTIPSVLGEDGYENEACFGTSANIEDNGYGWIDENENRINMEAKIFFPGVDGIRELSPASEKQADVYYNLSGQRVAKPATPGLYIRNNSKVIVH